MPPSVRVKRMAFHQILRHIFVLAPDIQQLSLNYQVGLSIPRQPHLVRCPNQCAERSSERSATPKLVEIHRAGYDEMRPSEGHSANLVSTKASLARMERPRKET